jgi:hypothetical protein
VPNLTNQKQPPWYQSSLRNEVLFASVSDVGLSSLLSPPALAGDATYSIDAYFNNAKGTCYNLHVYAASDAYIYVVWKLPFYFLNFATYTCIVVP